MRNLTSNWQKIAKAIKLLSKIMASGGFLHSKSSIIVQMNKLEKQADLWTQILTNLPLMYWAGKVKRCLPVNKHTTKA
jgi:hypothetical protein